MVSIQNWYSLFQFKPPLIFIAVFCIKEVGDYHSALKRNEIQIHAAMWMDLEDTMLS